MSPSKILSLIHESVQMIDDGKILEETVEVAEGLVMNSQNVEKADKNSITESVKKIYDFIIAF